MKYKKILLIALLVLFFVGLNFYHTYNITSMHIKIDVNNIESIRIYGTTIKGDKFANQDETRDIINWFNSTTDIKRNKDFQGGTPDSGIIIQLKSGVGNKTILISKSGQDFEVQRYDKHGEFISYWGKQNDIKNILKEAAGE